MLHLHTVPNETKDLNVKVLYVITKINESNSLVKHISCNCKCRFEHLNSYSKNVVYNLIVTYEDEIVNDTATTNTSSSTKNL